MYLILTTLRGEYLFNVLLPVFSLVLSKKVIKKSLGLLLYYLKIIAIALPALYQIKATKPQEYAVCDVCNIFSTTCSLFVAAGTNFAFQLQCTGLYTVLFLRTQNQCLLRPKFA